MSERPIEYVTKPQLKTAAKCDKIIDDRRRAEIFNQLVRHLTAIVWLVAELVIGRKPEKL